MRLIDWCLVYSNFGAFALTWFVGKRDRLVLVLAQVEIKLNPGVARALVRAVDEKDTERRSLTKRLIVTGATFLLWPIFVVLFALILLLGPRVPDLGDE